MTQSRDYRRIIAIELLWSKTKTHETCEQPTDNLAKLRFELFHTIALYDIHRKKVSLSIDLVREEILAKKTAALFQFEFRAIVFCSLFLARMKHGALVHVEKPTKDFICFNEWTMKSLNSQWFNNMRGSQK